MQQNPPPKDTLLLRTVAHALRHSPESHFPEMDSDGWVDLDLLVLSMRYARRECADLSSRDLRRLAGFGDAARFEIAGNRIRALYGHSHAAVEIPASSDRPVFLFHGTSAECLAAIRESGLRPMQRRFVHLSSDWHYARSVAHTKGGTPVVLVVGAWRAAEAGVEFRRANGHVWLADEIPSQFIIVPSPGQSGWGRDR